jgi:hypothetical protein
VSSSTDHYKPVLDVIRVALRAIVAGNAEINNAMESLRGVAGRSARWNEMCGASVTVL